MLTSYPPLLSSLGLFSYSDLSYLLALVFFVIGAFEFIPRLFRDSKIKPEATQSAQRLQVAASRPRSCLFALLIGIDNYKKEDITRLGAAVADVNEVRRYLMTYLGVPEAHIEILVNEAATRIAIIDAIRNLSKNANIHRDDAILIYFAGHGSRANAPDAWRDLRLQQHIEVIVPYDMGIDNVASIPDRTLGALLISLAHAKGNNITVILDSCHSGSGTRNDKSSVDFINRSIEITDSIPPDLDREIWGEVELSPLSVLERSPQDANAVGGGFTHLGETSHVLLAACQPGEQAREEKKHGVFTYALLEALEMYGIRNLTYANLLKNMKSLNNQNPQCEGQNKNRLIFDANPPPLWAFELDVKRQGNRYILQAGKAHGIVEGARFHVYENQASRFEYVSSVSAITTNVRENTADLLPEESRPIDELAGLTRPVALQTSSGPDEILLVYSSPKSRMCSILKHLIEQAEQANLSRQICLVDREDEEAPFVGLDLDSNNEIVVEILDQRSRSLGISTLRQKVKLDNDPSYQKLSDLLGSIAHFHWHLKRIHCRQSPALERVTIEFSELTLAPRPDEDLGYLLTPKTDTFVELIPNSPFELTVGSKAEMTDSYAPRYGFTIRSQLSRPLYVSMFHFDVTNFRIIPYYQPPSAGPGHSEPSLPANGVLAIGYGQSDLWGWNYYLEDNQDKDLAYLKVFFSTQPVDLSFLEQNSIFDIQSTTRATCRTLALASEDTLVWWTITIPMVLNRAF